MNNMKQELINNALEKLTQEAGLEAGWYYPDHVGDYHQNECLSFRLYGKEILRKAVIKKEIRSHHIPRLLDQKAGEAPLMLVAERLSPAIKDKLCNAGIDWLDAAGNIRLTDKDVIIWIDCHDSIESKEKKNRAFTKTGLKVVFLFLHDEVWLNRSYRDIANTANVALGNIKYVLDGLKAHNFILNIGKNKKQLKNRDKLLDQWVLAFTDELKPRIFRARYRFFDRESELNWKQLNLAKGTLWGGEPAADLLMHDLKPMEFILYTNESRADLMKAYKLIPDNNGNVEIREPYWTVEANHPQTVPVLTVYTDLMETGDPRNVNIAQKLYAETHPY